MSFLINHLYRFGEFAVDTQQRVLLRKGKLFPLPPKVFDTLLILISNGGRIVAKEELMRQLWPDTFVEEANLTFNIQQLRKALGDQARHPRYIETVPRRGYRFIADVEEALLDGRVEGTAGEGERRTLEPATKAAAETARSGPGPDLAPRRVDAPAARVSARAAALAALLAVALFGVGLVAWKLYGDTGGPAAEKQATVGPAAAALLKLEKLTETGQSRLVAMSPDGKYIAYTRDIERRFSIWLRHLATNTNVEIVSARRPIFGLAFHNGGEYLYFVEGNPTALYRVSILGGVATKILDQLEGKFSFSPDGGRLAFVRQRIDLEGRREYSLLVAGTDGSGERALLLRTYPDILDAPLWSPNGESIICSYGYSEGGSQDVRLLEVEVASGATWELSPERFFRITRMAWLPDKSGLILSARKNLGDHNQLWRVSYPGMETRRLTDGLSSYLDLSFAVAADKAVASQATLISDLWVGRGRGPRDLQRITQAVDHFCWAPNRRLVYTSTASGNRDLWSMRPDGTEQRQLTVDPAADISPAVTRDNRYVAFISNRSGSFQVWRMNLDGSNQVQLTTGAGKNFPSISADGKWVFFNTTDDWHLWKTSIEGGEPVRLTDYIAFRPALSPDGQRVACIGRTASKREILILPAMGGEPLQKIEFAGWSSRLQWTEDGKAVRYAIGRDSTTVLMRQPLGHGKPVEVAVFAEGELFDFGYSLDGLFLAALHGAWQHDVVMISDPDWHDPSKPR